MRLFLLLTVLIVGLMAGPAPAAANNLPAGSVGDLLENCEEVATLSPTHTTLKMGICIGFVVAVLQISRVDNHRYMPARGLQRGGYNSYFCVMGGRNLYKTPSRAFLMPYVKNSPAKDRAVRAVEGPARDADRRVVIVGHAPASFDLGSTI